MTSQSKRWIECEADASDRDMFNLSQRLGRLAAAASDPQLGEVSRAIHGMRWRVQKHMSPSDISAITQALRT